MNVSNIHGSLSIYCYTLKNKQRTLSMFVFLMFFGRLAFCTCYTLKNKQMESINVCSSYVFFWRTGFLHLVRLNDQLLV